METMFKAKVKLSKIRLTNWMKNNIDQQFEDRHTIIKDLICFSLSLIAKNNELLNWQLLTKMKINQMTVTYNMNVIQLYAHHS